MRILKLIEKLQDTYTKYGNLCMIAQYDGNGQCWSILKTECVDPLKMDWLSSSGYDESQICILKIGY